MNGDESARFAEFARQRLGVDLPEWQIEVARRYLSGDGPVFWSSARLAGRRTFYDLLRRFDEGERSDRRRPPDDHVGR